MSSRIKGITVEIGGDTSGLEKSLAAVNNSIKKPQIQLQDVNNLLKLDPSNIILCGNKKWLGTFEEWSRMDLSGESVLLYCAVLWFWRQFLQWLFSGAGICHRPEHPERSGDQLRNYWKVHRKRNLHDCGDQIRPGLQSWLG